MKKIIFPLKLRMTGEEVGNLQDALHFLLERGALLARDPGTGRELAAVLKRERTAQTYGSATAKTIELLQNERNLPANGDVDERTAKVLNGLLGELGALDAAPAQAFHIVSGTVRREDRLPLANIRVQAAHEIQRGAIRLGEDTTDAEGRYTIRYALLPGSGAIALRVFARNEEGQTLAASEPVQAAGALEIVDLIVPFSQRGSQPQRIEGAVTSEHGVPAENLRLRLYRRDFGGEITLLAETATLTGGRFAFTFDSQGRAASLEVRALTGENEEVALTKPLNDLSRGSRTQLNLVVPDRLQPLAAEYRRLSDDLTRQIGQMPRLADARENEERQDLTVLNRATGWDARLIALAAVSERLAADRELGLPKEALYGFLRAGLPSDKLLLAQVEPDAAETALKKVRDAGIVGFSDDRIAEIKSAFAAFSNRSRLNLAAPGSNATYRALLESSGLPRDVRDRFVPIYLDHEGDAEQLWQKAREAGITEAQVGRLQLHGKLAFLAANSDAMTARLLEKRIDDPAQLVARDLFKTESWVSEIYDQAGIPANRRRNLNDQDKEKLDALIPTAYTAEKVEDRLTAYAEDMARKVRLSYPTQVVGRLLETDEAFRLADAHEHTVALMKRAAGEGFRLGETPVANFLESRTGLRDGMADLEFQAARRQMQTLQRVYQITPNDEAMPVLMSMGMTSAFDVMAYPESEFVILFEAKYQQIYRKAAASGLARRIRDKAKQVSSVTYNLFTIAKKMDSEPPVAGLSAPVEVRDTVRDELVKRFPTMESLFGSMDFCECEHCRSVLSPAAYLVDLLQFLDPEPEVWGNFLAHWKATHDNRDYPHQDTDGNAMTPYEVLVARRPDLPHIPLTCENTHTVLPYIDIVNEILEYYVAHGQLEEAAAHDTGEATTEELLAEPQNVIREAYDALHQSRYPLNLPFDLWIETVRRFCNYFETPLDQVLETFRPGDDLFAPAQSFDRAAVFMESLGLAPAETAIFTDPDPLGTWHELYGFANAAQATTDAVDAAGQRIDLNSAKALSRRLGVTYKEIAEIVQTAFVNPGLARLGLLHKLGHSIHDARFYRDHRALLGRDPDTLSSEDRKRQLEVASFAETLTAHAERFQGNRGLLETEVAAIPFGQILVLADPDSGCNFDLTILRYADGTAAASIDFLRINLFVRLWRKLGWSIEETDRALTAFIPASSPFDGDPANLARQPLRTALIYLAHLKALDARVRAGKQSRLKLLALWSDLATTGKQPLYAQLFLTRGVLKTDPVFDHPLGLYLSDPSILLKDHLLAIQGALGLTAGEIGLILEDAGKSSETAALSLANVSLLYRYGLLAKALKLPVGELITLKQLSGIDPFMPLHADPLADIAEDRPFSHTLRFVDIAEEVKSSGLNIEDLDYLLRHRFDETGKYREQPETAMGLLKSLADGVRAIRAEHGLPADPAAMTAEVVQQKLGLGLAPDVVAVLLAMIDGTVEFTASRNGVAAADQLPAAVFADESAIGEVSYNDTRQQQKLTLRGVLHATGKTELRARLDPELSPPQRLLLAALLDDIQAQARTFFENRVRKQRLRLEEETGFLEDADFEPLFLPLKAPLEILPTDTPQEIEDKLQENESVEAENQTTLRQRRIRIAKAFLPYLRQRLVRQFITATLTAHTGAEPSLVGSLVTDERLLASAGGKPLLDAFAATGEQGLDAAYFDSNDLSGPSQPVPPLAVSADTNLKPRSDSVGNPLAPANSARFEGYLEVPAAGAYRFYIELEKQNASAELRFDHLPDPLFLNGTAGTDHAAIGVQPDEFLELKPGIPYRFSISLENLAGGRARLLVQGENLPKAAVSQLTLYPASAMAGTDRAVPLLAKALQLVQSLGLNDRETRYLLTHGGDFGGANLGELPTEPVGDAPAEETATTARFGWFLRLAGYARLKRGLAGGTDDLIGIFEANGTGDVNRVYPLIARLTRRDEATVRATAEALTAAPGFASEQPLSRLWQALQAVERFGVPVASIQAWTRIAGTALTPDRRFGIARDVKEAIKARFEPETWQRVAQPIFDALRQRQRDALVSHVLHQRGFDRMEQLYEYFLIDPGMEPVVQTSRIRLAIASVQLFVQRCLLNLELSVHPATINAKHWAWMKRYRVWEANRKIFLFPENWLEPEFRDDKTHLFAELEGALLEGDVSNDLVEDAFLNYLKKLDELARLDIVAMHIEDNPDPARRVLHVFGRTFSMPHKYFYRRYAHQMWTPWEPVATEIEGDHLAPVVWRDRLYLFWVTFMDKPIEGSQPTGGLGDIKVTDLKLGQAVGGLQSMASHKSIEVQLHWSEYLRGEWSTPEIGARSGTISKTVSRKKFSTDSVFIHVSKAYKDGEEAGVYITLGGVAKGSKIGSFYLAGRNSPPEQKPYRNKPANPFKANDIHPTRYGGSGPFTVTFNQKITTEGRNVTEVRQPKTILKKMPAYTMLPCNGDLILGAPPDDSLDSNNAKAVAEAIEAGLPEIASLIKPIFLQTARDTFFVEPNVTEVTLEEWKGWIKKVPRPEFGSRIPDVLRDIRIVAQKPWEPPIPELDIPWRDIVDPASLLDRVAGEDWLTNPSTGLQFDGEVIGPAGRAGVVLLTGHEGVAGLPEDALLANIHEGSSLPMGTMAAVSENLLQQAGIDQIEGSLNIVGAAGFNSSLAENFETLNQSRLNAGTAGRNKR